MWTGAVRRLTGGKDRKGQYEALEQQHATVQMADINGLSPLHNSASDQQDHEHLQVDYMAEAVSHIGKPGLPAAPPAFQYRHLSLCAPHC